MDPVICTPLKVINHPKGNIFHALRSDDDSYHGFGEAYFTTIRFREIKGWKKHSRMILNLIVPVGAVRFYVKSASNQAESYDLGVDNYARLTIPPGYWVAFEGMSNELNLILNVASVPHDPSESENLPLDALA